MRSKLLLLCAILLIPTFSHARLGETKSTIEARLLKNNMGIEYPDSYVENKIKDNNKESAIPYRQHINIFTAVGTQAFYFKNASGEKTSPSLFKQEKDDLKNNKGKKVIHDIWPDGWDFHVVFFKDRSVFEAYRRNDRDISEIEYEQILALNKGNSHWVKGAVDKKETKEALIDFDIETENKAIRSLKKGKYVIIYEAEFDHYLKTIKVEKEKKEAPTSIQGF